MPRTTLKNAPELPAGWSWLNDTKLGQKPHWVAIPPSQSDADSWADRKARVKLMRKSWGGSPAPCVRGDAGALSDLEKAGYVKKTPSGWWVPTAQGLLLLG